MTTKPAPAVAEFAADSLEKIAYGLVKDIATFESNDRNRLGYQVWGWLKERRGTIEQAVMSSGSRTELPLVEVAALIKKRLNDQGMS
jgi:hypothetical protein